MPLSTAYGVVVMADALGVRNYGVQECKNFITARGSFLNACFHRWTQAASVHNDSSGNLSDVKLWTLTFADNIVLAVQMKVFSSKSGTTTFPTEDGDSDSLFYGMWLERVAYLIGDLIRDAIEEKILFRGAMSVSEFIIHKKSNSILGPAVTDVASWYEAADTIGVVLTPNASMIIDRLSLSRSPRKSLKKFSVPMRKAEPKELYAVNWANAFCKENYDKDTISNARERVLTSFARIQQPKGTEQKFESAIRFFEASVSEPNKANSTDVKTSAAD